MDGVFVVAQAASQKVAAVAPITPPISFDWTINIGHIATVAGVVLAAVILFNRLQWRIDNVEDRLERFEAGLEDFKRDFKELGSQVVKALLSIARLEGRDERPLSEILREEDKHKDRGKAPHELSSRKK